MPVSISMDRFTPGPVRKADSDTLLNELMTAMMQAEAMPDLMLGRTMWKNVYCRVAPRLQAASSTAKSKFARLEVITRMM